MASRIDSVPPDDTVPQASGAASVPPLSIEATMATISASYLVALGQRSACRGLAWLLSA